MLRMREDLTSSSCRSLWNFETAKIILERSNSIACLSMCAFFVAGDSSVLDSDSVSRHCAVANMFDCLHAT